MVFFGVIVENVEFASPEMLELCTKSLIGMFNN